MKLRSVLLEGKSSIDLHVFEYWAIFNIIDDILARRDLNILTGNWDLAVRPCGWLTPKPLGSFNHLLSDGRKA
jgi:hypothetical protein